MSRRRFLAGGVTGLASTLLLGPHVFARDVAMVRHAAGPVDLVQPRPPGGPHALAARSGPLAGSPSSTAAQAPGPRVRILPSEEARFIVGARFDLRIEASDVDAAATELVVTIVGPVAPPGPPVGEPELENPSPDRLAVTYRGLSYPRAGAYRVTVRIELGQGAMEVEVGHQVVAARPTTRRARNVILFLGDGMGTPMITAARILSKGITRGRYDALLEMDQMEYRGTVSTSGPDSLVSDSANSMSAYMTGHKASFGAMGVHTAETTDPQAHPRVENIIELVKREREMAIGVVTTARIQDATPAATWAHTPSRHRFADIMDQALSPEQRPDVLLGGGLAMLLPQSQPGSARSDERDLRVEFQAQGFTIASTGAELEGAIAGGTPDRLLGAFHLADLDPFLDRLHSPSEAVLASFPDQPSLPRMTVAALAILETKPHGFFLMVEGALIDKVLHTLDGARAAYDTIELDQALAVARGWAAARDDTLIIVTADHGHSVSVVGTHDRTDEHAGDRSANRVYVRAGFPSYLDADGDGFPDDPDAAVQLFFGWSNHPDYSDDFRADPTWLDPTVVDASGRVHDNPERDPSGRLRVGNLPEEEPFCVHTVDDVPIFASGPGAERFNAHLDNTEVFFAIMDALGVGQADG